MVSLKPDVFEGSSCLLVFFWSSSGLLLVFFWSFSLPSLRFWHTWGILVLPRW